MLFEPGQRFRGLPADRFDRFGITDPADRRRAIVAAFHPPLEALAEDLLDHLRPLSDHPLHAHLPRLDWPPGYKPFCTWLALSREAQGYQRRAQLNVGVHRDYVAVRLGWDVSQDAFGRFEFLCLHAGLGEEAAALGRELDLRFRVYAAAPWPHGSREVFESADDWRGAFEAVHARGVWFELGERYDLPHAAPLIGSPELGRRAARVFTHLLPLHARC